MSAAGRQKVAVVRGAALAVGSELLRGLHQGGYAVVLVESAGEQRELARLARRWSRQGLALVAAPPAGSSGAEARQTLAFAVQTLGRVDACVLCPSLSVDRPLPHVDGELWGEALESLTTVFNFCQAAAGWWLQEKQPGQVLCLTSGQPSAGEACGQTHHALVAGAISALVHSMARELRHTGIRINGLALGARPPDSSPSPGGASRAYRAENVAALVEFFTSSEARDLTGQLVAVHGQRLCLRRCLETAGVLRREGPWTAAALGESWLRLSR